MSELRRECELFCRHLAGVPPPPYVTAKYVEAHAPRSLAGLRPRNELDADLVAFARGGRMRLRLADAYAALFARGGLLRRKLVLLLAILESHGETSAIVDRPDHGSRAGFFLALVRDAVVFAATLTAAVAVLTVRRARRADRPAAGSSPEEGGS